VRGAKAYRGLQDGELVALVAERDPGALEALLDRHGGVAYALARRILDDSTLAEDVVRGVFLTLWRDAGRLDLEHRTVATFVLAATHHRAVDVLRREENLRRRQRPREALRTGLDAAEPMEEGLGAAGRRARVRAALAELPEPQREALLLAYFGGYTQREVASLVGAPLATVRTRMAAGMRKLRDSLRDAGQREQHPWSRR
jgi:RNA polymerase sigma-70 factor (ECF subfamily)